MKAFILLGISNFLAYFGKYGISLGFTYYKQNNFIPYNHNETTYNNTTDNSNQNETIFSNDSDVPNMADTDIIIFNKELRQSIFMYISGIYISCIIVSILLYSILIWSFIKKKEKNKDNNKCCENCCLWNIVCEICGCIIYSERVLLEKNQNQDPLKILDNRNRQCCECWKLCCQSINNYCNNAICNMCNCRKNSSNICCCCDNFDEKKFDKNKQCFCYCYQEKSFCLWMNNFLVNDTQREIILCMMLYFISRLSIVGCQKDYEYILQNNDIMEEILPFLIAVLFIIFNTILISLWANLPILYDDDDDCEIKNTYLYNSLLRLIDKFSLSFVEIIAILYYEVGTGFEHSIRVLFTGFDANEIIDILDETFMEKTYLYSIVLTNVFIAFLLNYYCLILAKNKIYFENILSQTILVSIYILLSDGIIYLINYLLEDRVKLFSLQMAVSGVMFLIMSVVFLRWIYFSFVLSLNCCWRYKDGICNCQLCCCNTNSKCYRECCNLYCSKCNCFYIYCEPCCSKISDALFD